MHPLNQGNPIKLYIDGSFWCALFGEDLQSGVCGFGKTPEAALKAMLEADDSDKLWEQAPHGQWDNVCPGCGKETVDVMPYPFPHDSIKCTQCGAEIPISSEPKTLN